MGDMIGSAAPILARRDGVEDVVPRLGELVLPVGGRSAALRRALLESRQRWRQFVAIAADMVFEADGLGRLTFVSPDGALGWPAASLLGQPGLVLLHDRDGANPFCFTVATSRRQIWLRAMDGTPVCMAITTLPLLDEVGRSRGVRGAAVNVTEQERANAGTAGLLRKGTALDRILADMRQEVMAPRMMRAVLDGVMRALGGEGAGVLTLPGVAESRILYRAGTLPEEVLGLATRMEDADGATQMLTLPDGRPVLACVASTRYGEAAAMVVCRAAGTRGWDSDDRMLASSVTGVVRIVLEHEAIQRELARQARTDPLTGLLNRRAFIEEASRRLDRLEAERLPATILFVDLDGLKQLNDRAGHEAGDAALVLTSALLRRTFRPTDLVARLGGDEFACWLDGSDSLTAAERAEGLRLCTPHEFAHLSAGHDDRLGMSIGIATREPGSDETLEQLINRADAAMYAVKRNGRGHWQVSHVAREA